MDGLYDRRKAKVDQPAVVAQGVEQLTHRDKFVGSNRAAAGNVRKAIPERSEQLAKHFS